MHAIPATRVSIPMLVAASTVVLMLVVPTVVPGCGPGNLEVDKAALYTPESLASELAYRYQALNADAKKSTRKLSRSDKAAADKREHGTKSQTKGGGVKKKAPQGPKTIDDVLEDIDSKLDLIKNVSRPAACVKMMDTISKDSSLTDSDKKSLNELVGRLADEH
jgi:ATP-dependent 26S proteasome regulatory subunit